MVFTTDMANLKATVTVWGRWVSVDKGVSFCCASPSGCYVERHRVYPN